MRHLEVKVPDDYYPCCDFDKITKRSCITYDKKNDTLVDNGVPWIANKSKGDPISYKYDDSKYDPKRSKRVLKETKEITDPTINTSIPASYVDHIQSVLGGMKEVEFTEDFIQRWENFQKRMKTG